MFLFVCASVRRLGQQHGRPSSSGCMLLWRSTCRPAQDIRFQHCTQCGAVEQGRQQAVDTVIRPVLREARRAPSIQLPAAVSINRNRKLQLGTGPASPDASDVNAAVQLSTAGPAARRARSSAESLELQQLQAAPMPSRKIRPSCMDFEVMYQQLEDWKQRHMTAHVPRYCFDAPELGAWVRKMRKQYKDGKLELWKSERLNLLQFEWKLTDQEAKWHHLYHQLRRYQLMHGSTDVDVQHNEDDGCDWSQVAWWLKRQARMLAKQKLSSRHHNMLSQLGVTLRIPKRVVTRTAALQALNGPERRKLRKKWKHLDAAAAEAAWEQQQQKLEQQQEQQQQQQEIASRRLTLLQDAIEVGTDLSDQDRGKRNYGTQRVINDSSSSCDVTQLLQQQYLAQMGLLQHNFQQQQQQQESRAGTTAPSPFYAAAAGSGSGSGSGTHDHHQQHMRQPIERFASEAGDSVLSPVPNVKQPQQQPHTHHQQQGLLYQRNRRYKRVRTSTKQERWMSAKQ